MQSQIVTLWSAAQGHDLTKLNLNILQGFTSQIRKCLREQFKTEFSQNSNGWHI